MMVTCNSLSEPRPARRHGAHGRPSERGPLILGIGAGWFRRDYDEYGYEFGTGRTACGPSRRALPRIEARLGKLDPPPVRAHADPDRRSGEKVTLRLVAEHAHAMEQLRPARDLRGEERRARRLVRAHRARPGEVERTVLIESDEIDQLDAFLEAGAQHLIVGLGTKGEEPFDLAPVQRLLDLRG